ncbi:hypothetical protein GJ496_005011 [Pomphorhynchus laevis]|nr:hypothetical protein GJ496_005011 [Pomphorhynchus laevis]
MSRIIGTIFICITIICNFIASSANSNKETKVLPECIPFFASNQSIARHICMPYTGWTIVRDLSNIMLKSLLPYFHIQQSYECSIDVAEYRIMLCSMMYTPCDETSLNVIRYPCEDTCFEVLRNCWSLTPMLSCHLLPKNNCVTTQELSKLRSRFIRLNPKPVPMEVTTIEDNLSGHQREPAIDSINEYSTNALLLEFGNFFARNLMDIRFDQEISAKSFIQRIVKSMPGDKRRSKELSHYLSNALIVRLLEEMISILNSKRPTVDKTDSCINDIFQASDKYIAEICQPYVSWKSFRDNSSSISFMIKYFELKPSFYCSFDLPELNLLLCIKAFPPCKDKALANSSQLVCSHTCLDILRNCWTLTTIFKCISLPNESCISTKELNLYRSRYMQSNPPTLNVALPIINLSN